MRRLHCITPRIYLVSLLSALCSALAYSQTVPLAVPLKSRVSASNCVFQEKDLAVNIGPVPIEKISAGQRWQSDVFILGFLGCPSGSKVMVGFPDLDEDGLVHMDPSSSAKGFAIDIVVVHGSWEYGGASIGLTGLAITSRTKPITLYPNKNGEAKLALEAHLVTDHKWTRPLLPGAFKAMTRISIEYI
jgi:type 1 fimbria pilin